MKKKTWKETLKRAYKENFEFENEEAAKGFCIFTSLLIISFTIFYGFNILKEIEKGFQTFTWLTYMIILSFIFIYLIVRLRGFWIQSGVLLLLLTIAGAVTKDINLIFWAICFGYALFLFYIIKEAIKEVIKTKKRKGCKPTTRRLR